MLNSCNRNKEEGTPEPKQSEPDKYQVSKDGNIVLGKKLENPYSVENMRLAYSNLVTNNTSRISADSSPVRVTHYYVRFLPKDWNEYEVLKSDTTLKLYDTPLDFEIVLSGWQYHDPLIPEGNPTWQYTSVKKDYSFNTGIKYEILSELYLPETDPLLTPAANLRVSGKSLVDALVDEAMILTKNYSDTLKSSNLSGQRITAWKPSGIIKVWDTRLGRLIPLERVRMRARRWFDIRETSTNADGWYQISGFDRKVNYALFFETDKFDVRTGTWVRHG